VPVWGPSAEEVDECDASCIAIGHGDAEPAAEATPAPESSGVPPPTAATTRANANFRSLFTVFSRRGDGSVTRVETRTGRRRTCGSTPASTPHPSIGPHRGLVLNVHSRGPPTDQHEWRQHRRTCPCVTGTCSAVGLWKVESCTDLEAGLPVAIDHLRDHHSKSLPTNSTEGIRPTMAGWNDPDGGQERSK